MNLIDVVALVAIGFGAWRGFRNGVIIEVASLLGLIVGVWAGLRLAFVFANYYRENFDLPENYIPLLAFLSAFLLGIGGVYLVGRLLNSFVNSIALGIPNRMAGATFGAAKWAFLLGTALTLVGNSLIIPKETQENSIAYPALETYCKGVQEYTVGALPAARNVLEDVESYFVSLDSIREEKRSPSDSLGTAASP